MVSALVIALTFIAVFVTALILWRFFTLRSRGYPVMIRRHPSPEGRHWRHSILIYGTSDARLYKLRSLRVDSDLVLPRHGTEILGRRELSEKERGHLEDDLHVATVTHGGQTWEIAVDQQGDTALVAWLESAPSERLDTSSSYRNPRPLRRRRKS